jgi:hypothetical protein
MTGVSRQYEHFMRKALNAYQSSVADAILIEKEGGFTGEKDGGSNHGSTEAIYRLHATRLKCLIAAASYGPCLESAEMEALRLTEKHWFSPPIADKLLSHRERIWNVFVDIVLALARCRLDHSFFHRSIYRQAQALMWSNVLYDPASGRLSGSLGTVPAHLACKLRGLNYATSAADSAIVVISSLFEKKRSQLCAVWVTEGGAMPSVFQTLNNCVRKYDSLRGKYISAYVESLRLCNRAKDLETFLRWTYSSPRDLPDFFAASAINLGDRPPQSRAQDSLVADSSNTSTFHFLTSIKRITNSALASVLFKEIKEASSKQSADALEEKLKILYASFLRINCNPKLVLRHRFRDVCESDGVQEVTKALIFVCNKIGMKKCIGKIHAHTTDWSGQKTEEYTLLSAIEKCKTLFPSLTGGFFSAKKVLKAMKYNENATITPADTSPQKMYSVTIPVGLNAGDTFVTIVKHGDKKRKLRLSVPAGSPKRIRFTVSSEHGAEILTAKTKNLLVA